MCGIAGFHGSRLAPERREAALTGMTRPLFHRGPDSEGCFLDGGSGLGMRRLRIIDLSTGDPPIFNETRDVCVVFNGEIYNYRPLRARLEAKGHRFVTRTDTEVIVHLYEEESERFVESLRGMFAIALLDMKKGRLVLARDRVGIKPLYHASLPDGTLLFGSELKSILAYPGVERQVDPVALNAYLAYFYVPDPLTIFRGIQKLPPGHVLVAEQGRIRISRYWDVPDEVDEGADIDTLARRLEETLDDAVGCHLESDVPLGAFLSGGIDSSAVVATMTRVSGRPPQTFSIGFREARYNELDYAREVARMYKTDHHEATQEAGGLETTEKLLRHFDEPFADSSMIPTHLVSGFARSRITVALSGDGGDEIFAGYSRYLAVMRDGFVESLPLAWRRRAFSFLQRIYPAQWRGWRKLGYLGLSHLERDYVHLHKFPDVHKRQGLYTPDFLARLGNFDSRDLFEPFHRSGWDPLRQITYLDLKTYLPGDILTKVDRMSMAHGLEARVPLLDHLLVEQAFRIPSRYRMRDGKGKWLFRRVVDARLPEKIRHRPKRGFAIPLAHWLTGPHGEHIRQTLLSDRLAKRGFLNTAAIQRLWQEHRSGRRDHAPRLWALYCLEVWFRAYCDESHARAEAEPAVTAASGPAVRHE
jgi:asparagine synthase (glutamine-hydrolysing)